jgi:4-amino-4-deoxy-L-arabinose transferase-like glycosyltransferase
VLVYLVLAAVLRAIRDPPPDFDERIFLDVGRHILDAGLPLRTVASPEPTLFFDHTPLYVYVVAALTALGGPTLELIRASTLVAGVITVLLVFRMCLDVRGVGSGFVAAMLLATSPFFARYSWYVRMEVPLCLCLVLGLYLLNHRRALLSGLAIAIAVMFKEIALAFWVVAAAYALVRYGWRFALLVGTPTVVAFAGWVAYAMSIGSGQFIATMDRWLFSAGGADIHDPRLRVGLIAWTKAIVLQIVGPILIFASGATAALALTWRRRIPPIVAVPIAYMVIAVAASYVIRLKEPRFLIAVIPMLALTIGLMVDWDDVWAAIRGRDPAPPSGNIAAHPHVDV